MAGQVIEYTEGTRRGFQVRGRTAAGVQYRRRFPAPVDDRGRSSMKQAKAAADAFLAQQENAKHTGTASALDRKTTVGQYAQRWADTRLHKRSTARRVGVHLKHITDHHIGSRPLYAVTPSEVQAWVTDRSKVLSPGTLRNTYAVLKATFAMASEDGLRPLTPCKRITLPRAPVTDFQPLTIPQVAALIVEMPDRYKAMVTTQAGLGLRVGELLSLQVKDVDFLNRRVRIERQQSDQGANLFTATKNEKTREVPLPKVVADALSAHLAAEPQPDRDGLIFRSRFGNGVRQDYYTQKILRPAVERLELTVTSHDLRHHYVSVLLDAGEPVTVVAARIGDTVAVVVKTYAHVMPDTEDRTRLAIDKAWAAAQETLAGKHIGKSVAQHGSSLGQI